MYFIAFSGEDANLWGSEWYAEHPLVPLSQIRYLFNLDMIGDNNPAQYCEVSPEGERGYKLFEQINKEKGYFKAFDRGELAGNSDHWPFAQRNVPCIFLENKEGDAFKYYHTIYDTWESNAPLYAAWRFIWSIYHIYGHSKYVLFGPCQSNYADCDRTA